MPDLNELLKWSILNSAQNQATNAPQSGSENSQLSLRFNPATSNPSAPSSALHPNDPQHRSNAAIGESDDISPASTPGPATPMSTTGDLPLPRGVRSVQESNDILEMLMGKPDSTTMREKLEYAQNAENDVDSRVEALDDFEMMIELIDNANNLVALKMWEPLLKMLEDPEDAIVAHICWIIGTAVQNNLTAQAAFFAHNALTPIVALTTSTTRPTSVRAKAVYALSSSLKHWPMASSALSSSSSAGFSALKSIVNDSQPVIRRKAAFLVGTLVMQSGEKYEGDIPKPVVELIKERMDSGEVSTPLAEALQSEGVLSQLLAGLKESTGKSEGDVEYEENAVRGLSRAAEKNVLSAEDKAELKGIWESWGAEDRAQRGLEGQDAQDIETSLA